jgi:hypothetical protein
MNPLIAIDCIACAVMPTAPWLMPVAVQNRITRSCAVSTVIDFFAMAYSRRQIFANACHRRLARAGGVEADKPSRIFD